MSVLLATPKLESAHRTAAIDIVLPVHNQERVVEGAVRRLRRRLDQAVPYVTVLTIVDQSSVDDTWAIASHLAWDLAGVRAVQTDAWDRGRGVREAWSVSEADVVAYLDVACFDDFDALWPMLKPLIVDGSNLSVATASTSGFVARRRLATAEPA